MSDYDIELKEFAQKEEEGRLEYLENQKEKWSNIIDEEIETLPRGWSKRIMNNILWGNSKGY